MRTRISALAVAALLAAPVAARADEVHLNNGGTIVGKVVEATADTVRVKTRFGIQTVARRDVARIEYKPTPEEAFDARFARIGRNDVGALLELAAWARQHNLRNRARRAYERVTEVDPGNRVAHEALGHVRFEGRWMTGKEAAAAKRAREVAAKRAQGLVRYQGAWVTREEKEARERGWIKVGERWLPPEEANRARGLVRVNGEWVPREEADARRRAAEIEKRIQVKFEIAATPHCRVFSEFGAASAKTVGEACEKALAIVREQVGYADPVWKPGVKAEVVLLRTPASYMKLTDATAAATKQPKGWAEFTKRRNSFYTVLPPASVQHLAGRREPDMVFCAVHHVGHIALNGMYFNYTYLPVWLDEGFAVWVENATLKQSLTACATAGYGVAAPRRDKWSTSSAWKANLKAGLADGSVAPMARLLVMRLNEMGWKDIAKAWSVIDWWIRTDRAKFLRFVRAVRRRYPRYDKHAGCSPNDFLAFQNAALKEVFGLDADGIEHEWRSHVSADY